MRADDNIQQTMGRVHEFHFCLEFSAVVETVRMATLGH
jgi:hypothetical protein